MIYVPIAKFDKFDRHRVSHIVYDKDGIKELIIIRQTGETVYSWNKK
jgi:hypothetical protein